MMILIVHFVPQTELLLKVISLVCAHLQNIVKVELWKPEFVITVKVEDYLQLLTVRRFVLKHKDAIVLTMILLYAKYAWMISIKHRMIL